MFRLGQQIRRDEIRTRCVVGNDHDFRRSRNRIDSHDAKHELLRRCDILVPGPVILSTRDRLSAEGQRRDRLRTTNRINLSHVEFQKRRSNRRIL